MSMEDQKEPEGVHSWAWNLRVPVEMLDYERDDHT
jgi:hypothetical protein